MTTSMASCGMPRSHPHDAQEFVVVNEAEGRAEVDVEAEDVLVGVVGVLEGVKEVTNVTVGVAQRMPPSWDW